MTEEASMVSRASARTGAITSSSRFAATPLRQSRPPQCSPSVAAVIDPPETLE